MTDKLGQLRVRCALLAAAAPPLTVATICFLLPAICYLLSAICYLLSAICYLLSAICYPFSAVCCLHSAVCCLHVPYAVCRAGCCCPVLGRKHHHELHQRYGMIELAYWCCVYIASNVAHMCAFTPTHTLSYSSTDTIYACTAGTYSLQKSLTCTACPRGSTPPLLLIFRVSLLSFVANCLLSAL
jgi:hypothetical protein